MANEPIKVFRASRGASAGIVTRENSIQIIGGNKSAIEVNQQSIGLVGDSVSFGMSSANIRTGGLFVQGDEFTSMIPSTLVTLIPQRLPFPPLGFVMGIVAVLPIFIATLVASQAGGD